MDGGRFLVKKRKRCDEVELRKDILEKIQSQHDDTTEVLKKGLEQKDRLIDVVSKAASSILNEKCD